MDTWYYARDGQQHGPYPRAELLRLLTNGTVNPRDYVWTEGMPEWQPANEVPGLIRAETLAQPGPPATDAGADEGPVTPEIVTATPPSQQIPNYLPWAIVVTLCCCIPGGIVAIVYSTQATAHAKRGDWDAARAAAEKAKLWLIWSAVLGAIASLVGPLLSLLGVPVQ